MSDFIALRWRIILGALFFVGCPAWTIYWLQSSSSELVCLYAIIGYVALAAYFIERGISVVLEDEEQK